MGTTFEERIAIALVPEAAHACGAYTEPRSYGVYRLADDAGAVRRYRFGNHPVRQHELAREFGDCELVHLFLSRSDAEAVARHLNGLPPPRPH